MNDERLKKTVDPARVSRAASERHATENRQLTEEDRLTMFRQQFFQDALPDLPKIPGYHLCWLTTTNPRDSIQMRIRLGYEPVKPEDVPGWEYATVKTGEWAGHIGVNEMLAFKISMDLYQMYMNEAHHEAPMSEDEKLTTALDDLSEQANAMGGKLHVGDGLEALRQNPGRASFEEV